MANVGAGTTFATPLVYPATSRIDRSPGTGNLYALFRSSTADLWELWRSTNGGASWGLSGMPVHLSRANVQDTGSLIVYEPFGFWCYRTNEGGQDRIYYRRFEPDRGWHSELLVAAVPTGGFNGALDMQVVGTSYGIYVAIGVGVTVGAQHGMQLFGVWVSPAGAPQVANEIIAGPRQWLYTGAGRVGVSLDIEHSGDPHSTDATGSVQESVPHLWAAFGRTNMYAFRAGWNGYGWNPPTDAVKLNPATLGAQDQITGRWDGWRFVTVAPDPTATDTVAVYERARPNSSTAIRRSQVHPTGVVRNCSFNYNEVTQDIRVYAIGTSTQVLYFCDYIRATNTWSAWSTVTATAILGATGLNYSPRRGSRGARYDILTAHSGAPNTVVHTGQSLSYPPNAPLWDTASMGRTSGNAADVAATLPLDWTFTDPDPADVQSNYALSKQVGAGALSYWRASDSTWQPAEVMNPTATTAVTLPAAWGVHTDAATQFRVKVWDGATVASPYGDPLVVIPSQKVNPTISTPAGGSTITGDTVAPTWTVSEQTAYRLTLLTNPGGLLTYDSGWVTSAALTAAIPTRLADGSGWTLNLQTRNNEGLPSSVSTVTFTVDFVEPPAPMTTAAPSPGLGVIVVTAVNGAAVGAQPAVSDQDIYRRPVAGQNMLSNPSFAADTTGWLAVGGSIARTNAQAHSADGYSALLTPDGVTATPRIELAFASIIPVAEGQSVTVEAWLRPTTANKPLRFGINWFTSVMGFVATSLIPVPPAPVAGAWQYLTFTASCPPGATRADITCGLTSTPAVGDTLHVDDARWRYTNDDPGVRVASALASGGTVNDWGPAHGVAYEYRSIARGVNGTSIAGPWLA